jgi:hypothetical protein
VPVTLPQCPTSLTPVVLVIVLRPFPGEHYDLFLRYMSNINDWMDP